MKTILKKLGFILTIMLYYIGLAQQIEPGNNFYFSATPVKASSTLKLNIVEGSTDSKIAPRIQSGHQIKILNVEDDIVYFKYLSFQGKEEIRTYNGLDEEGKMFSLKKTDFLLLTKPYFNRFRGFKYGAYTVPIRLRSENNNFEFDSNLSLGGNIVGSFSLSRFNEESYVDLSFGVGITKVNLNSSNSLLGTDGTEFADIDVLSPAAFTLSLGGLINLAKNVNFGIYWGWDFLSTADNKADWLYNKKPWLGIGLNVTFSNTANQTDSKK